MIARVWKGTTRAEHSDAYLECNVEHFEVLVDENA